MTDEKKYERLTKKYGIGRFVKSDCITCKQHKDDITGCDFCGGEEMCNKWCCGVLYNRLAELEDKIENGTLYDFKFKIGQEVYIVCDWDIDKVVKGTITEIELTINKNGTHHRIYVDHDYIFLKESPNKVQHRYIFWANELYTDKAEAETKLKELQND